VRVVQLDDCFFRQARQVVVLFEEAAQDVGNGA